MNWIIRTPARLTPSSRLTLRTWLALFIAIGAGWALAACEGASDETKKDETVTTATVPADLASECESLASGGKLNVDTAGRDGTLERDQCRQYTFVGDESVTYAVVLTVVTGNANLIVAFNDSYTSLVGTSENSGTVTDTVVIDSALSAEYFIAVTSPIQASTFNIAVKTDDGDGGTDTTAPTATDISPADGATIAPTDAIVITFDTSMDTTSLVLAGVLAAEADGGVWSQTTVADDTLTISPATEWTEGADLILTVDATDTAGNALTTLPLTYTVSATAGASLWGTMEWGTDVYTAK